jgi:hypothetical protein
MSAIIEIRNAAEITTATAASFPRVLTMVVGR